MSRTRHHHRRQYVDRSCRRHGSCSWCRGNRTIQAQRVRASAEDQMSEMITDRDTGDETALEGVVEGQGERSMVQHVETMEAFAKGFRGLVRRVGLFSTVEIDSRHLLTVVEGIEAAVREVRRTHPYFAQAIDASTARGMMRT